ncbi:putative vinorine synthase [Helianthus debilis subsp. tardiflorus]
MPLILFYPKNEICSLTADGKARKLKKSLSQTLTRYYPFAGQLHTPTTTYVDCNDEGVVFVEAKHDSLLHKFQHIIEEEEEEEDETLGQLFADDMCLCHIKLVMAALLAHTSVIGLLWRVMVPLITKRYYPHLIQSPATTNPLQLATPALNQTRCANLVTIKFVFPNSKLRALKNKVYSINNPTRFEVLSSLIYKTAVSATTRRSSSFKPYLLSKIPKAICPKVAPKYCGKCHWMYVGHDPACK